MQEAKSGEEAMLVELEEQGTPIDDEEGELACGLEEEEGFVLRSHSLQERGKERIALLQHWKGSVKRKRSSGGEEEGKGRGGDERKSGRKSSRTAKVKKSGG